MIRRELFREHGGVLFHSPLLFPTFSHHAHMTTMAMLLTSRLHRVNSLDSCKSGMVQEIGALRAKKLLYFAREVTQVERLANKVRPNITGWNVGDFVG